MLILASYGKLLAAGCNIWLKHDFESPMHIYSLKAASRSRELEEAERERERERVS